jgi:predicted RNA-binding Zn ribbon-like protein
MHLAKKYAVPGELALLYEFLNSVDLRRYTEKGVQHIPSDELATPAQLEGWMHAHGLLARNEAVTPADHRLALELRTALRSFVELPDEDRTNDRTRVTRLNAASSAYPLVLHVSRAGAITLQPSAGANRLGRVVAEFFALAQTGRLNRLKMCSSSECQWVFFDRSKPGNRRWCSSSLCGNRQKTRAYRGRLRSVSSRPKRHSLTGRKVPLSET